MKIAFCGIDGCGKSTQIKKLNEFLINNNKTAKIHKVQFTPYHLYKSQIKKEEILSLGTAFDFLSDYMKSIENERKYDFLLYDRHKICYLAMAKAYNCENLNDISKIYSLIEHPDLMVYFDNPVEISLQRISSRNKEISNRETYDILKKFKEAYEFLINLGYYKSIVTINSNQSIQDVTNEMKEKVYKKIL